MDILEKFLIAIGGGATAIIVLLTLFKAMFLKAFGKAIDTTFEKNIAKYRNKLSRTTTAYEILLKKEFDYYQCLHSYIATLVPLVQDLVYYAKGDEGFVQSAQREKYREHLLNYLKMIPELKNYNVLYQPYIPQNVWLEVTSLIVEMQTAMTFWKETGDSLFGLNETPVNVSKAEQNSNSLLMKLAIIQTAVKNRLTELSEA